MESRQTEEPRGIVSSTNPNESLVNQSPAGFWIYDLTGRRSFLTIGAIARGILVLFSIWIIVWIGWQARGTLLPFAIGALLALIMAPLVELVERWMPRRAAIAVIYLVGGAGIIGGFIFSGQWLAEQIQSLIDSIPSASALEEWVTGLLMQWQSYLPVAWREPVEDAARSSILSLQENTIGYLQGLGSYLVTQTVNLVQFIALLTGFIVLPFWIYFVLDGSPEFRQQFDKMLHTSIRDDFWALWSLFMRVVGAYLRGTLILGIMVAIMVAIGMWILRLLGFDVPNILLLSLFSGVGEFIPYIGPVISSAPAIVVMLSGSFNTGLAMLVVYIIVQQLENNLLVPWIMGESIRIHPAIMTVVLFAAGGAFGFVGLLLAPPIAAFARDTFVYLYNRLQGNDSERAYAITRPSPEELKEREERKKTQKREKSEQPEEQVA